MTTEAFVSQVGFWREKAGSPGEYTKICQVTDISGLGQTNPLIDATTFCSTAREYIGGLPDGSEMTITLNMEQSAMRVAGVEYNWIWDVQNQVTAGFRITLEDGSPEVKIDFDALCLSWGADFSTTEKNSVNFTLKISGAIAIS